MAENGVRGPGLVIAGMTLRGRLILAQELLASFLVETTPLDLIAERLDRCEAVLEELVEQKITHGELFCLMLLVLNMQVTALDEGMQEVGRS